MSCAQIALESAGGSSVESFVIKEAKKGDWKQWWPEADLVLEQSDEDVEDGEDAMTQQTELFLERSKKRMSVFQMAKEIMLAQRYATFEKTLIDTAIVLAEKQGLEAKDVKSLSGMYKDLMNNSVTNALASMTLGTDASGLPTVIMRDLSGGS